MNIAIVITWIVLYKLGSNFYMKAVKKCDSDFITCIDKLRIYDIPVWIANCIFFAISVFLIIASAYIIQNTLMRGLGILLAVIIIYDLNNVEGSKFEIGTIIVTNYALGLLAFLFLLLVGLIKLRKRNKKIGNTFISLTIFLILLFVYQRTINSCRNFDKVRLDPEVSFGDNPVCPFSRTKLICWHDLIDGIFKPIEFFDADFDCQVQSTDDSPLYRKAAKSSKLLSVPRVHEFEYEDWFFMDLLQKNIEEHVTPIGPSEIKESKREVFYDFRKEKEGQVIINLKSRMEEQEISKRVLDLGNEDFNVLHIFLDTVSRNRFYKILPKTADFLRRFTPSKRKSKAVYEFFRMHAIRGYTEPNLKASEYGTDSPSRGFDRISSHYRSKGFITGYAKNYCSITEKMTYGNSFHN